MPDIDPADQITLHRRRLAVSLAQCPGWTEWALPLLCAKIKELENAILNSTDLSTKELKKKRAAFQALTNGFLGALHSQAEGAFASAAPSVVHTDADSHMPSPDVRDATLKAFTHKGVTSSPAAEAPSPPKDEPPSYSPFQGQPVPARKKPKPEESQP